MSSKSRAQTWEGVLRHGLSALRSNAYMPYVREPTSPCALPGDGSGAVRAYSPCQGWGHLTNEGQQ